MDQEALLHSNEIGFFLDVNDFAEAKVLTRQRIRRGKSMSTPLSFSAVVVAADEVATSRSGREIQLPSGLEFVSKYWS